MAILESNTSNLIHRTLKRIKIYGKMNESFAFEVALFSGETHKKVFALSYSCKN